MILFCLPFDRIHVVLCFRDNSLDICLGVGLLSENALKPIHALFEV